MFQNRRSRRRSRKEWDFKQRATSRRDSSQSFLTQSIAPPERHSTATSALEYSSRPDQSFDRASQFRRSTRRFRNNPPGGRRTKRGLPYPLKVTIVALLVAGTGISFIEMNRRSSVAKVTQPPTDASSALMTTAVPSGTVTGSSIPSDPTAAELAYNVTNSPALEPSFVLQEIVDDTVGWISSQNLPTQPLSITLIDVKNKTIAGYQAQRLRYPASVAKMFWMVAYYARLASGRFGSPLQNADAELYRMMYASDNTAAARIVDWVTNTTSGDDFNSEAQFNIWARKREWINRFFRTAGYDQLTLCHKNFPFDGNSEPTGRDLKFLKTRSRNQITTYHSARLIYEIMAGQAVSPEYSRRMARLLMKDLRPESWTDDPDNPIKSFLGESLSHTEVEFASKVGWTSESRQEAAYIKSRDGKTEYILVIFGDHPDYANSWQLFPQVAKRIHQRMLGATQVATQDATQPEPSPTPPESAQ